MLEHAAIIALIVLAIWYTYQEGEIFGFMQRFSNWKIAPALFECNVCMTPYYGSALYVIIYGINWQWPVVVICAMGINIIINKWSPDKGGELIVGEMKEKESENNVDRWTHDPEGPESPFVKIPIRPVK